MTLVIWMAAAEAAPLAQSGGVADVLRALPQALSRRGHRVRRFLPAYGHVDRIGFTVEAEAGAVPLGPARTPFRLLSREDPDGVRTSLIQCEELFGREGIYGPPGGSFPDNPRRFTFLGRAVCALAGASPDPPDILHLHDWHTALAALFVRHAWRGGRRPRTVLTIHNMGYQGRFGGEEMDWLALEPEARAHVWHPDAIEDHGGINFLKAGLVFSDRLTAVSPTYAREIQDPPLSFGLEEFVRRRRSDLVGILNGADYEVWNPAADPHLPRPYGPESLEAKDLARRALRRAFQLPDADRPVLGVVSRLAHQKGIDLVTRSAGDLLASGTDLVVLGAGDPALVRDLETLRGERPDRVGIFIGFDESLSHLVTAGSDIFLVPSRYEPCGLTQMHALRYGTIPVARRTGGLADTIRDEEEAPGRGTGFLFDAPEPEALAGAAARALARRRSPEAWRSLQLRGMAEDFSWDRSAGRYLDLYGEVLGRT